MTARGSLARGGFALVALGALVACAPEAERRSGFGPTVRICQGVECRDVPRGTAIAPTETEDDRRRTRQADADVYRGQDPRALAEAAAAGDARAAYLLGQVREFGLAGEGRRPAEAARLYGQAADAGLPWAQFRLAHLLESGQGVARDGARALRLTAAAAEAGHAQAAYNLAMAYRTGRGVPRSAAESAAWMRRAADGGVPEAQYALGLMHFNGDGAPRQLFEALRWMRLAAENGDRAAQKTVGRLYMTGLDTMGQDLAEARTWLTPVANGGDAEARRWLQEIARAEAEELAFRRELQLQAEQTRALITSVVLAALLTPPPVIYVSRW